MPRGLDHIVHAVRDLDAGAELYRKLGFTVGARNRHSWGTHNYIVQLPGFFVELLTVAEPEKLGTDGFSNLFGRFNQSFLAHGEGLSMLLLEGHDAAADAAAFSSAGIAAADAMTFEREGKRPDGTPVKLGFSLAFARDAKAPDAGFATCQNLHPENFWNPAFQQHRNSVSAIAAVVLVADNPADHHVFLSAYTGVRDLQASSNGITAATPRGDVKIMDPAAFRHHFGTEPPDVANGARFAALQFRVRDGATLSAALGSSGIPYSKRLDSMIVAPANALGATLVFS
jgi:glyoxalase-like protein